MAEEETVVLSVGMMTSVGLSALETAASVRASTSRFTEVDWRDRRFEPFKVARVLEDGLPELEESLSGETGLTYREARMLRLATLPLMECLKPIASRLHPIGLVLALPDREPTIPLDRPNVLDRL